MKKILDVFDYPHIFAPPRTSQFLKGLWILTSVSLTSASNSNFQQKNPSILLHGNMPNREMSQSLQGGNGMLYSNTPSFFPKLPLAARPFNMQHKETH